MGTNINLNTIIVILSFLGSTKIYGLHLVQGEAVPRLALESFCGSGNAERHINIKGWGTSIFEVGFVPDPERRHFISKCEIKLQTDEGFGLVAAIEHMKIRGTSDPHSNRRKCEDYIKFVAPRTSLIGQIFEVYDVPFYRRLESEKLCGETSLNTSKSRVIDMSTDANSFRSPNHKMNFVFEQQHQPRVSVNNSFVIVVTSYKSIKDEVFKQACEGKFICRDRPSICIDPKLVCDGHINCAFVQSGNDESKCKDQTDSVYPNISFILLLVGLLASAFIVCATVSMFCNAKKRLCSCDLEDEPGEQSLENDHVRGMSHGTQAQLAAYMHGEENQKPDLKDDLPPSYDALFPSSPELPKDKEAT